MKKDKNTKGLWDFLDETEDKPKDYTLNNTKREYQKQGY